MWQPEDRERLYDTEIAELYDEFARQVYFCVRSGLLHEDAEEIVNFSFMAARLHWRRVREYKYPVGYVMKVAQNQRADVIKRSAGRHTFSLDDPAVPELASRPSPENDDDVWRLREALRQLSPREQQITILYYWTELPYKEIAEALGISEGHIGRTLSDARARLLRLLSKDDDDKNGS